MSKRFIDKLIIRISQEAETGLSVANTCRKHNCPEQSFYRREVEFGRMDAPETSNS